MKRIELVEGEPLILYRDRGSVQAALVESKGREDGLAGLMRFLRCSLRVRSGPQGRLRWMADAEPSAVLMDKVLQQLDPRSRTFTGRTSQLERHDRSRIAKISDNESMYRALLLTGNSSQAHDISGFGYQLTHEGGLQPNADEMWRDLLAAVPVATFVQRHFPAEPVGKRSPENRIRTSTTAAEPYTLPLDSFKPRPGLVPLELLHSRTAALKELNDTASVVADRDPSRRPPHGLTIVSGTFGTGKSELIQEWLVRDARNVCPDVSEVLFISNCSTKTEDEVCGSVRDYLDACEGLALVVLDGLAVSGRTNELIWTENVATRGSVGLIDEFARQIGKKPFMAVLGVQLNTRKDASLGALEVHPRNQARIANVVQLETLDDEESAAFLAELTHSETPMRKEVIDYLVKWSRGNPLLLCIAASGPSVLHDRSVRDLSHWRAKDERRASRTEAKLREGLNILDGNEGGQFAAMRFVALFRRPHQIQVFKKVLEELEDIGVEIERVNRQTLQGDVDAQPLFAISPSGSVELHSHVKEMVARDLEVLTWREGNHQLKREIKAIHAVAARRALQLVSEQLGLGEHREKSKAWANHDVETLFDLAYHLLGTRSPEADGAAAGVTITRVPELERLDVPKGAHLLLKKAIQGTANNDEIERAVWRHVMNPYRLTGSDLVARNLFGLRLALLHRMVDRWPDKRSASEETPLVQRGIRMELGACSLVAGDLLRARKELAAVHAELHGESKRLPSWFFKSIVDKTSPSSLNTDKAVKLSAEYAKVVSTYSTVLFRMGRLSEALDMLSEAKTGVADHLLVIADKGTAGDETIPDRLRNRLRQVARQIVTRWCEAILLSTGYGDDARERLDLAFTSFNEIDMRDQNLNVRERTRPDPSEASPDESPGARLMGESARAYVRLAVRMANQFGMPEPYIASAEELVNSVRVAAAHDQRQSRWSNDSIGCLLDEVTLARQAGRFTEARDSLAQIDAEPRYKNLGGCSMALKYEVKMAHAKLALVSPDIGALSESEVLELQGIAASAALTGHVAVGIDAHLLLAMNAHGQVRQAALRAARDLYDLCRQYRVRDDMFVALETDQPITQKLSIFS